MKASTFLISDLAAIDKRTNTLSVFNIMRELTAESLPVLVQRLTVVAVLEREEGEQEKQDMILRIKQSGRSLFEVPLTANFGKKLATRNIMEIHGLVIKEPEPLIFQLVWGGRQRSKYRVLIRVKPGIAEPTAEDGQD